MSPKPAGPVQAFAPPELSTTARARPSAMTCWDQSTGAALTRFAVKTAAATSDGPSLTTSATSRPPLSLRPAATPLARNPFAAVTLTAQLRRRQAGGLGQAEHQVGVLHRLPAAPLPRLSMAEVTITRPESMST